VTVPPAAIAYKVLTAAEMAALEGGTFAGSAADVADGFIHLSSADQLAGTLERHYAGVRDLWIAAVDLSLLGDALRWEESRGGALFPHLYESLPLNAVLAYGPLERDEGAGVRLPVAG
jgi:uncharacterized protein (DUF952 family)